MTFCSQGGHHVLAKLVAVLVSPDIVVWHILGQRVLDLQLLVQATRVGGKGEDG